MQALITYRLVFMLAIGMLLSLVTLAQDSEGVDPHYLIDGKEISETALHDLIEAGQSDSALTLVGRHLSQVAESDTRAKAKAHFINARLLGRVYLVDSALYHGRIALQLIEGEDLGIEIAIRAVMGEHFWQVGDVDLARIQLDQVIEHKDQVDQRVLAKAYYNYSSICYHRNEYQQSIDYLYKALPIFEELGDLSMAATVKSYIGVTYHSFDKDSLGLIYQQEALDYFLENGELIEAAYIFSERGNIYNNRGEYEKAESDLIRSLEISKQTGLVDLQANTSDILAATYVEMGRADEAIALSTEALAICRELDVPIGVASCLMTLAEAQVITADFEGAYESALEVKAISDAEGFSDYEAKVHEMLADLYARKGDYEKAYAAKLIQVHYNDSVYSVDKAAATGELREQYEREKNLRTVAELKNAAEVDALKRKGLLAGLVIVSLLSALIINREIKRRKKARQLHEAKEELAQAEHQRLQEQLDYKNRELTSNALNMARKNEFLTVLNEQLLRLNTSDDLGKDVNGLRSQLRLEGQMEDNWEQFTTQFTETNPTFYTTLKVQYPDLTKGELKMAALLKMNLSNKDIAHILSISDDGVKKARYRMRKKFDLQTDDSLEELIMQV